MADNNRHALDDAAARALWALRNLPVEHMGLLFNQAGAIQATPTQSTDSDQQVSGTFAIPKGSLLGLFHNHPPAAATDYKNASGDRRRYKHSRDDIIQSQHLGVPSYIAAGNKLRKYDPKTKRTTDVLAQIPVNEIKKGFADRILNSRMSDDMKNEIIALLEIE